MQSYSSQDDLAAAVAELSRRDGRLGLLAARHGVPPLRRMEPGLASLLRIVTDQLISLKAADAMPATLILDVRELQFLNSSGINTLSKFILRVRNHKVSQVVVKGSARFPWQEKSLVNLQRLLPALKLEIA